MKNCFFALLAAVGSFLGGGFCVAGENSGYRMDFLSGNRVNLRRDGRKMDFAACLREQFRTRKLSAVDVVKLCYQSAYGPEHLLKDKSGAEKYFFREFAAAAADKNEPLVEIISPDICRVNLRAWKAAELPPEWLFRLFAASAGLFSDGDRIFAENMATAEKLISAGESTITIKEWRSCTAALKKGQMVRHSKSYHASEKPSYRIISTRFLTLLPLLKTLAQLPPGENGIKVIAIDGRAASGKSTLGRQLGVMLDCDVVQMDDFFLPEKLRTPERVAEAGGNVHYERFQSEVLPKLRDPAGFVYGRYDCSLKKIAGQKRVKKSLWRIVEGAYSHSPRFGRYADYKIFFHITPGEQRKRILKRNGAKALRQFISRWIPMEEKYISTFNIPGQADIILK